MQQCPGHGIVFDNLSLTQLFFFLSDPEQIQHRPSHFPARRQRRDSQRAGDHGRRHEESRPDLHLQVTEGVGSARHPRSFFVITDMGQTSSLYLSPSVTELPPVQTKTCDIIGRHTDQDLSCDVIRRHTDQDLSCDVI